MRKGNTIMLLTVVAFIAFSCSSSKLIIAWKSPDSPLRPYKKIMVVGVVKDSPIAIGEQMETHLVNDLKDNGFIAVSALAEFGKGGLANLEQEETYIKLCNRGIDAVITVALLDRKKEKVYVPGRVKYYSNLYYYNRIWNYSVIQADLLSGEGEYEESVQYFWETILFDLQTLSPVYTVQTKSFDPLSLNSMAHEHGKMIVAKMLENKILIPPVVDTIPLKAF
jgi:hypothetical protein